MDVNDIWDDDEDARKHVVFNTALAMLAIVGIIAIACIFAIAAVMSDSADAEGEWTKRLATFALLHPEGGAASNATPSSPLSLKGSA